VPQVRFKYRVEYALLRAVAGPGSLLPYRTALCAGWLLAAAGFHAMRSRARTAEARIRSVFGNGMSEDEARRIAWISWRNIVFNAIEMTRVRCITRDWLSSAVACGDALDVIKRQTDTGRGAVIAVPHMGNWDLAGIACHFRGIPILNIAARQKNPLVNAYINRLRGYPGIETMERGSGTMRTVLQRLRGGSALAILPDVRVREGGLEMDFLGGRAHVGKGPGMFAYHAGVPVFQCFVSREGWTGHRIAMDGTIFPDAGADKEGEIRRITEQVVRRIDEVIRRRPDQWFWFNRRWILDPRGAGREKAGISENTSG
jgi:KDO2-lipid IV(A) lauroyltransferase